MFDQEKNENNSKQFTLSVSKADEDVLKQLEKTRKCKCLYCWFNKR